MKSLVLIGFVAALCIVSIVADPDLEAAPGYSISYGNHRGYRRWKREAEPNPDVVAIASAGSDAGTDSSRFHGTYAYAGGSGGFVGSSAAHGGGGGYVSSYSSHGGRGGGVFVSGRWKRSAGPEPVAVLEPEAGPYQSYGGYFG